MFRCITKVKAFVIDADSFDVRELVEWNGELEKRYKCLFMMSDSGKKQAIEAIYGSDRILRVEPYIKSLAPNRGTHQEALDKLNVSTTELIYVSRDKSFIDNAMGFLCGSIWITETVSYDDASTSPDLICRDFKCFVDYLLQNVKGFFGEVAIYQHEEEARGVIIPVGFETDGVMDSLYMIGRYFGYSHYMSQLHPYSSTIFLNKREGGKAYGQFDIAFERIYRLTIQEIQRFVRVDVLCSVPPRPGKRNRFEGILKGIAESCGIENVSQYFSCVKDYSTQKNLSQAERTENVKNVFEFRGNLAGKSVIIIDDVISTGSTMRECIRELRAKGAGQIYIVVLAINQLGRTYWSSNQAYVCCPNCREKMSLFFNSHNHQFFYSCYNCRKATMSFDEGRKQLCDAVNNEFSIQQ